MTRYSLRKVALLLPAVGVVAGCGSSSSPSSANWIGKTYLLDTPALSAGHWTKPVGFGSDIGGYVPQFLIGIEAGSGSDLMVTLTTATLGVQDMCNVTTEVSASGANYPKIDVLAPSFPMRIMDSETGKPVPSTAHNLELKDLLPGNSGTASGELDATVDVAELYSLFHLIPNATKESVCSTFASYNVSCETCASNGQPYCLTLQATQIAATSAPAPIQKVTASDIAPTCSQ